MRLGHLMLNPQIGFAYKKCVPLIMNTKKFEWEDTKIYSIL